MAASRLPFREVLNQVLRAMTILSEPGRTPEQALDLIREVNQPGTIEVRLTSPLTLEDKQALDDAMATLRTRHSDDVIAHVVVAGYLLRQLAEATGQTQTQVIQRMALDLDAMLPPNLT